MLCKYVRKESIIIIIYRFLSPMFHRIPPYFEMKKDIFMESMLCEKNFERDSVRINKRGKIGGRLFGLQCRSEYLSSLSLSLSLAIRIRTRAMKG